MTTQFVGATSKSTHLRMWFGTLRTVPIPTRSCLLNGLGLATSAWIGACLTQKSPHYGALHASVLLVLTLASVAIDEQTAQAFGTRWLARKSGSQGIIEGALALPWFLSGMGLLGGSPSIPQFHRTLFSSCAFLVFVVSVLIGGSQELQHCEMGASCPASQQKRHLVCRFLTSLAACLITALSLMEIRSFGGMLEMAILTGASVGVYFLAMYSFPSTFTVGEGWVVSQGIAMLCLELTPMAVSRLLAEGKAGMGHAPWRRPTTLATENAKNWTVIILAFALAFTVPLALASHHLFSTDVSSPRIRLGLGVAAVTWAGCCGVVGLGGAFRVLQFVARDSWRVGVVSVWLLMVVFGAGAARLMRGHVPNIMLRKWFHFLAVMLFLPGHVLQPALLDVALACAFAAFLVLEGIRFGGVPTLAPFIHNFFMSFTDERDSGSLIWTHFSLLLGMAVPIWVFAPASHAALSGVVVLGIGDSAAAIVGSRLGKVRICSDGDKTLEGTLANFLFCMLGWSGLMWRYSGITLASLVVPTAAAACYEAASSQLDNVFIPLYYTSLLSL